MFDDSNLKFGLRLKTKKSLLLLEDWLDENGQGEWSMVLLNMDENMEQKEIEIRFQSEPDKQAFVNYLKGQAEDGSAPASRFQSKYMAI